MGELIAPMLVGKMSLQIGRPDSEAEFESATDMQSLLNDWARAMNRPMLAMPS